MTETQDLSSPKPASMQDAVEIIETLRIKVALNQTEKNDQVIAFATVFDTLSTKLNDVKNTDPKDLSSNINSLLGYVESVRTVGLNDLPDALKPAPRPNFSPAASPSLSEKIAPEDVHVTADKEVVISSTSPENVIVPPTINVVEPTNSTPIQSGFDSPNPTDQPPSV